MKHTPIVIGLTGGIGSGKSAVCAFFAEQGVPIIDTDLIARDVVRPGSMGLHAIRQQLGQAFITTQGKLNRSKLRAEIFKNPQLKLQLENIVHPLIRHTMLEQITHEKKHSASPIIVVAIPLLVESIQNQQRPDYLDEIWVVDCKESTQVERASQRDTNSEKQIKAIIQQQASREERLKWADQIIHNEGTLAELQQQLTTLFKRYQN